MENLFEMYLREMAEIERCSETEMKELLQKMSQGDQEAYKRMIEGNLYRVATLTRDFDNQGIGVAELIQEGNVALTMAVYDYTSGDIATQMEKAVLDSFSKLVDDAKLEQVAAKAITARVNLVNEAATLMAKELGREATVAELAEKLSMNEDDVTDAMKQAMDALEHATAVDDDTDVQQEMANFRYTEDGVSYDGNSTDED